MRSRPLVFVLIGLISVACSDGSRESVEPDVDGGGAAGGSAGISGSAGTSGSAGSGGTGALAALNDELDGTTLDPAWTVINDAMFDHELSGGMLLMRPTPAVCNSYPYCVWFQADNGPAFVKLVAGDFAVSASVRARRASNTSQPPPPEFQFAGLIARDPASDASGVENYVFTVMGERGGFLTNELKSTVNDSSQVIGPDTGRTDADAELRICRIGQVFRLYRRPIGGSAWTLAHTFDRSSNPLPAQLQVGPITYSYTSNTDVEGQFDWVRFREVATPADCEQP